MSDTPAEPIASPCIRICCLDDRDVCLGCFRSLDEIRNWQASDGITRQAVLARCAERRAEHDRQFPALTTRRG